MVFIKSIQINGFKTYKNQVFGDDKGLAQELSPGVNSIVGRNGSGKSNFFSAIQFVLSEKYSKLKSEERQALLHEGSGRGVMSAFVEIIFDNTDGRFPIDKKEVSIRRTIGLKKDEFGIDNKAVTQKEVTSLLESAGFSSSNPYYIVEQGKVSLLTTMKDIERLNLLKEVAGTRVYDEGRKEALKILQETESKLDQIKEVIDTMEEKLVDLEKEKKEYKIFQNLDKEKKSIEYTLYDKELADTVTNLENIEKARTEQHNTANQLHSNTITHHERLKELERKIKDLTSESNTLKKQRDVIAEERQHLIRNRTKIDLELKDEESLHKVESNKKTTIKKNLSELNTKIKQIQSKVDEITPKLDKVVKNADSIDKSLSTRDRRQKELFSKAGRQLKFKTTTERDNWIKNEVKELQNNISNDEKQVKTLSLDISKLLTEKTTLAEKIKNRSVSLEEKKNLFSQENQKLLLRKKERDDLANDKKSIQKSENDSSKKIAKLEEELDRNKKKLDSTSSSTVNKGIQEMWRIVREHGLNHPKVTVYGTVIELFSVDDRYAQAVEVVAGNALFNVVVENSTIASRIINIMNQQKSPGRITFMPLNRLTYTPRNYPNAETFLPLIQKLKFDSKFNGVMSQLFGKNVLAHHLDSTASNFSRSNGLNCVTLDGDQINSKGALSGGFTDFRTSRLETHKNILTITEALDTESETNKKVAKTLSDLESQLNMSVSEVVKIEEEINKLGNTITLESSEVRQMVTREKTWNELLTQQEKSLALLQISVKNNRESVASLEKELKSDLNEQLTVKEREELETLSVELSKLSTDQMNITRERSELETVQNELYNTLNTNLLPRVEELKEQLEVLELAENNTSVSYMHIEFDQVNQELESLNTTLKTTDDDLEKTLSNIHIESESLEKIKSEETKQESKLAEKANQLEKLFNKRNIWLKKKEDCIRQIRELGSLPQDHAKYEKFTVKELMEKLQSANEELKNYSHVNKKALDQYEQFSEQRDDFLTKKKDLDTSKESIHNLIGVLDKRKEETIVRTFKQVAKNFSEIFTELVPGGKASLIMNSSGDEETDNVAKCSGISITVMFHGEGEPQIMQQLSGGQKSLVALTLIFAIQRCDPAPFYLFDEIDAALDTVYRLAVAKMIRKQSENIQFVVVSFKKEMLDIADQFYGIFYKNKVSQIKTTTKQESTKILEDEERAIQSGKVQEEVDEETEEEE